MENFFTTLAGINDKINAFIWVKIGLVLLIGTGILMTCCTKWFQITHLKHWWQQTIGGVFRRDSGVHAKTDKKTISQFQALCTALAATIGTGNIAGVSAAIVIGGPGAVFWMWVAAFFGMMTNFSENVLGIYYRRRNSQGEWSGGAMYYLRDGLGGRKHCKTVGSVLAVLFSVFAILASFGIGNMGQINKIVLNMKSAFFGGVTATVGGVSVVSLGCGIVLMILAALIVIGGLQRIATVAERVVPFMAVLYIIGALVVFFTNIGSVGAMFAAIFRFAFGSKAVAGGAAGIAIQQAITQGCKRGVFSNEAGLGSSVMVHSSSNVKEPVTQGMWGIFEVFFDTFVVCTMTAIVVLSSGCIDLETGLAVAGGRCYPGRPGFRRRIRPLWRKVCGAGHAAVRLYHGARLVAVRHQGGGISVRRKGHENLQGDLRGDDPFRRGHDILSGLGHLRYLQRPDDAAQSDRCGRPLPNGREDYKELCKP